jgi:hypothetical protein
MVRTEQGECLLAIAVVIGYIARCTALASQPKNFRLVVMMGYVSLVRGCHLQCAVRRQTTSRQLMSATRVVRTWCARESC